jgi:hypothetical protein
MITVLVLLVTFLKTHFSAFVLKSERWITFQNYYRNSVDADPNSIHGSLLGSRMKENTKPKRPARELRTRNSSYLSQCCAYVRRTPGPKLN